MHGHYFFKKWFFDILTPGRDYIFLYFAFVNFFGKKVGTLDITISNIHGGPTLRRSIPVEFPAAIGHQPPSDIEESSFGLIEVRDGIREIRVNAPGLLVDLTLVPRTQSDLAPLEIAPGRKGRISWKPLVLSGLASGRVIVGPKEFAFDNAAGYEDYLSSNVLPFMVPIRDLQWGRIHHERLNIAYTSAAGPKDGKVWTKAYVEEGKKLIEISNLSIRRISSRNCSGLQFSCPEAYEIKGDANGSVLTIRLDHISDATVSTFLDTDIISGSLQRWLVRRLSKDPRGVKSFAKASVELASTAGSLSVDDILCIDEYVRFGFF